MSPADAKRLLLVVLRRVRGHTSNATPGVGLVAELDRVCLPVVVVVDVVDRRPPIATEVVRLRRACYTVTQLEIGHFEETLVVGDERAKDRRRIARPDATLLCIGLDLGPTGGDKRALHHEVTRLAPDELPLVG